jgi:hypothetical protein
MSFLDEKSPQQPNDGGYYGGVYDASLNRSKNYDYNSLDSKRNGGTNGTNASNRVGSPYSDYGSKRYRVLKKSSNDCFRFYAYFFSAEKALVLRMMVEAGLILHHMFVFIIQS